MAGNDRYVVKHGKAWAVKKAGVAASESVHRTQGKAEQRAKQSVRFAGGGEVRIQGCDGRWCDSDTVASERPVPTKRQEALIRLSES